MSSSDPISYMSDDFDSWLSEREKEAPVDNGELTVGTIVGDYRIVALLGHGGFADVYRAVSLSNEHVAIKILHRQDDQSRLRFEREVKILSQNQLCVMLRRTCVRKASSHDSSIVKR